MTRDEEPLLNVRATESAGWLDLEWVRTEILLCKICGKGNGRIPEKKPAYTPIRPSRTLHGGPRREFGIPVAEDESYRPLVYGTI